MFEAIHDTKAPFTAGEIVVVHGRVEREAAGERRASYKWSVESSYYDTPEEAVAALQTLGLTPHAPRDYPSLEAAAAVIRLHEALEAQGNRG